MTYPATGIVLLGPLLAGGQGASGVGRALADGLAARGLAVGTASPHGAVLPRLADSVATLVRRRRAYDVAVVMVFGGRAFLLADLLSTVVRQLVRRRLVLWLHGGSLPALVERRPRRVRRVAERADLVVAPSPYLARAFAGLGPPVEIVPNLLPLPDYPFRERREISPRLLWMRTFHALYRPEMALDVLSALRRDRPEATLTLAGNDEGRLAATRRRAAELGLGEAVRFAGFLDPEAKRRELAAHDVYLHTNAVDNAPVTVVEAAAAGLPVVATAIGGIPDLLRDGDDALLVPDGDASAMAGAVRRLLDDPGLVARLVAGGRRLAARSAPEAVLPRWLELLSGLADGPRAR